ncbi:type II toxin-antitoxin system prevent-host-death family antitoxin [Streptomyces sp. NPDC056704]|uniref:type II toxin-antitoxin system prevent-host-death family antitoxin n=1 Tax=Streptomyces sp. NPDC056704 TaxID=3345917 RepID=UPI0036A1328F
MSERKERRMGVSDVRANMTEVIAEVRILGAPVVLTRRETPQAVLISVADYEQSKALRRFADLVKERDADLHEELLTAATVKPRRVVKRRLKPDDEDIV